MEKEKMAKLAGGVVVGAAKGSVGMVRNVRGLTYRQRDFDALIAGLAATRSGISGYPASDSEKSAAGGNEAGYDPRFDWP